MLVSKPARRHSLLALWHLLSLDAPSVAVVWTLFLARCAGLRLPWVEPVAMFVAVWMIYVGDRLLDARRDEALEERHRFHHAHRAQFLPALVAGGLVLACLLHQMDARVLRLYAVLAALLGAWLLLVHASAQTGRQRLPKEIAVGLFFAAAVFIPTVARLPALRPVLLPVAALFGGVCVLNCLFVYAWEHPGQRPGAHPSTRWATAHLTLLAGALVAASLLTAVFPDRHNAAAPALACALSTVLLWALGRARGQVHRVQLRAAADLVLLTPLVWLLR